MTRPAPQLRRNLATDFSLPQVRALSALINASFPDPPVTLEARVEHFLGLRTRLNITQDVVWDGEEAIANASFFSRAIATDDGPLVVQALAAVCCSPARRGEGWGRRVVQAAWADVDAGVFPVSLFQTTVPDFYRKLGARSVDNLFINTGDLDPRPGRGTREQPWWGTHVMIYPGTVAWPAGTIDLCGPGY